MGRRMGIFGHGRALRAVLLACVMAVRSGGGSCGRTPISIESVDRSRIGRAVRAFHHRRCRRRSARQMAGRRARNRRRTAGAGAVRGGPRHCASPAALQFLAIVDSAKARDGRARLGEINRAINLAIRPISDLAQYGARRWSSPLTTFATGAGDCEDYAIAKWSRSASPGSRPKTKAPDPARRAAR